MTDLTEWSSNANDVFNIRIHGADSDDATNQDVEFQPAFTYQIFGNEETIFGYKDLRIQLDFAANTLRPSLNVTWEQKFESVGETHADEVEEKLREFLPELEEESSITTDTTWEPPGKLVNQYEAEGRRFGIWATNLNDAKARELLRNMQVLVLFFIEGGSLLELDDPDWTMERWTLFLVYAIDPMSSKPGKANYTLAGYSTAYRLFFLDTTSPLFTPPPSPPSKLPTLDTTLTTRLPCRQRISQFLVLPPYQHSGHGSILYNTMLTHFLAMSTVAEITVEDPNESFDDLRDVNDLMRLRSNPAFTTLAIDASARLPASRSSPFDPSTLLPRTTIATLRAESKTAPRQFARLVEMQLLSKIPPRHRQAARITRKDRASDEQDRAYYFWRMWVKQRLYRHNLDQLAQLEIEERVEKLEQTCSGVEGDYERLLQLVEKRVKRSSGEMVTATDSEANGVAVLPKPKRRRVVDDDDDDEDVEGNGEGEHNGGSNGRGNGSNGATVKFAVPESSKIAEGSPNASTRRKKKVRVGSPEVVDID